MTPGPLSDPWFSCQTPLVSIIESQPVAIGLVGLGAGHGGSKQNMYDG